MISDTDLRDEVVNRLPHYQFSDDGEGFNKSDILKLCSNSISETKIILEAFYSFDDEGEDLKKFFFETVLNLVLSKLLDIIDSDKDQSKTYRDNYDNNILIFQRRVKYKQEIGQGTSKEGSKSSSFSFNGVEEKKFVNQNNFY